MSDPVSSHIEPPESLRMRRLPQQKRSQEVVRLIEQATLALLAEQGFAALNTNAIAERAGIGIKSLYHLFPNKEAIIYRLAEQWLQAVRVAQQDILARQLSWQDTLDALDSALDALDERFVGYGPLWRAMELMPELHPLEDAHERAQIRFWSDCLRQFGCRWPTSELTALITYFYRTTDIAKQCSKELGSDGKLLWQLHRHWLNQLFASAVRDPDPAALLRLPTSTQR
ncbi:TetR/AcrR family transcriptional regulator [Permianibacter fluminis]|uniref:TetR/AcrR family transcriptional regulator n=1 Tax=Permianibacter fluminis TaxID=2738515 RepID=UPI001B7D87DB|nr:TetR/AcrR family transcriptional regulator [Permianibacter fluminis]